MKNTRLKNVIFTAGMAVFTGVLLLGINAAIGATPTAEPPGGGVFPTFTGVNTELVQNPAGDLAVSDNLAVTGNVTATGSVNASGNVTTTGSLNASGNVSAEGSANITGNANVIGDTNIGGDVNASGNLVVSGTSDLRGNVSNSTDFFTIDDDVIITSGKTVINQGNLEVQGYASFADDIHMDLYETDDNNLTGVRDIELHGELRDQTATEVTVNDGLDVYGSIKNTSTSPVAFSLIELVLPLQRPVTIDDSLVVTGTANLQGNVYDSRGDFTVSDNMAVTGNQQVNGNLTVIGAAKANRFGTYTRTSEIFTMLPAEGISWKYFSKACPAGQILVSCGGGSNWGALTFGELYPGNNNTCYLTIHRDNTGYNAFAEIVTMCLDPDA